MKVKHTIISGTNYWNPGDDFVRWGTVNIFKELLPDYQMNFLFYNFNPTFFPQAKHKASNLFSVGDMEKIKDDIDMIIVPGLSGGTEVVDLYSWILRNKLESKVFLIGGGYENSYIDGNLNGNAELQRIFQNAKILIGRTKRHPAIIDKFGIKYHHLNCPALLSNPSEKYIDDNKIEKILFSIQIPDNNPLGIVNQHTPAKKVADTLEILKWLYAQKYELGMIAHYKTEYFYYLDLFKKLGLDIPIMFSSFVEDYKGIYSQYDAVVSTRLHACIYGNSLGMPSFLINSTPRHLESGAGIVHLNILQSLAQFTDKLNHYKTLSLRDVATDLHDFKKNLKDDYVKILKPII